MKKVLLMAVALGAMFASADSYLYWMIGDTSSYGSANYAKVRAFNGETDEGYLALYYSDGTAVTTPTDKGGVYVSEAKGDQDVGLGMYAALGNLLGNTYSYIIELYNDKDVFLAQSSEIAYSAQYVVDSGMGVPGGGAATGTAYAIPEPTSGIMVLLGMATLALRRRRRA